MIYVLNTSALPFYVSNDQHFLFNDIQLTPHKVKFTVDEKDQELYYHIAPCGGMIAHMLLLLAKAVPAQTIQMLS